jgi:uncharacterized repeat protein (TIGR03806 family)
MKRSYILTVLLFGLLFILISSSFLNHSYSGVISPDDDYEFQQNLDAYKLYEGKISEMTPAKGVEVFELSTTLFVDYSEKQRLIKIPDGTKIKSSGNGLPVFPDGTIMAKTFYYYKDKRDPKLGKQIIETRLIIKDKSDWFLGTYEWNKEQTAATLINDGNEVKVDWIDANGKDNSVYFYIPTKKECAVCHVYDNKLVPIGPKLRSMNVNVTKNGTEINQLKHLQNIGWLDVKDISTIAALPDWEDKTHSLAERGRAYIDINCAHCHNPKGSSGNRGLSFDYETPIDSTGIALRGKSILRRMQSEEEEYKMPLMGTTILHKEGFEMLKQYIESLEQK